MAAQLQLRRGTSAENDAFTGAQGEVTIDTEKNSLRVHDGSTPGGTAYLHNPYSMLGLFFGGRLYAVEALAVYVATADYLLPTGLTGSVATAGISAALDAYIYIRKNGINVGTITFLAGAGTGTFTFTSDVSLTAGDKLEFINQATSDTTLMDVAITIQLTKV